MQYDELVKLLTAQRAHGQITGTAPTASEVEGVSGAFFNDASTRNLQGRQVNLGIDQLALERWRMQKMLEAANEGNRNQLIGNALKSGVGLAGLYYTR
jgi:hypothetical protein